MTVDIQLFHLFNSLAGQSQLLDGIIVFCASYLAYILGALFLALVFFSQYPKRKKWEILLVVSVSAVIARFGITELIRFFYHHPRPFITLPNVRTFPGLIENSWSFPSGHATFFFALSTALYLYNKKWGIWFFVATILITVSRVIAGIHYPSDIIGGAVIGIIVAYATFYIARKITAPKTQETAISTH